MVWPFSGGLPPFPSRRVQIESRPRCFSASHFAPHMILDNLIQRLSQNIRVYDFYVYRMPIDETFGFNEDNYVRSLVFMDNEELINAYKDVKKKKEEYDDAAALAAGGAAVMGLFTFGLGFLAGAGTAAYATRQQNICKQKQVMIEKELMDRVERAKRDNEFSRALALAALLNEAGLVVKVY